MRLERRRSGGWSEPVIHETLSTMRAVYERLPGDGYYVQVPGVFHADMTDVPMLASRAGLSGPVGVQRAHQIINAYSLAFFDRHLKGRRRPCWMAGRPVSRGASRNPPTLIHSRRRPFPPPKVVGRRSDPAETVLGA
jgi:hypothetical protein